MRNNSLSIFGASGQTGKVVVDEAIRRGFEVRTIVRDRSSFQSEKGATRIVCDLERKADIQKAIEGSDTAIIVFGPRPPYKEIFCARITQNIVKAMEELKIKRLICQTGAMIGDYKENRSLFFELMSMMYRKNSPEAYQDRVDQEKIISSSSLDWTLIKPPRLTDGEVGKVRVGEKIKVGLLSSVSRKSLAKYILDSTQDIGSIKKRLFIAS